MAHRMNGLGSWAWCVGLLLAAAGCSSGISGVPGGNDAPLVALTARPQPADSIYYSVRLQWTASDSDGQVVYFLYTVDPPAGGDTTWVRTDRSEVSLFFESSTPNNPLPEPGAPIPSSDYHVFALKAVDNQGASSAVESIAFTSYTVAPFTRFLSPRLTGELVLTSPTVLIRWNGEDVDGERNQKPVLYKVKLVSDATIKAALGITTTPNEAQIQDYFSREAPDFASWEPRPPDSTFRQVEGLTTQQDWYFAVVAFDEAGAYEPRFSLRSNVLLFRPITQLAPPKLSIGNAFFFREQSVGGIDLRESEVFRLQVPSRAAIDFHWFAVPGAEGTEVVGYRWVLDPLGGDIFDETGRETDEQTYRWSSWSITETQAIIGPFDAAPGEDVRHRFYVEARDNVGLITLVVIELRIVTPTFAKDILFVDDYDEGMDRRINNSDNPPSYQPYGNFPTQAVLDTLFYAVGGKPYKFRPPGTLSLPGVFAGLPGDSVDYRHLPYNGIPLTLLTSYKAAIWYTSNIDAGKKNEKFKAIVAVMPALRMHNTPGNMNTPAVFLSQGGKMFFFGNGTAQAISNGYIGRFRQVQASFPYLHTGDGASAGSILWPGNFLYDFLKVRSRLDMPQLVRDNLVDAIPYLPEFATPGAPWPPTPANWTGGRGPADDPRIGPSASRNVPDWSGLPILTLTKEFNDWPNGQYPLVRLGNVAYISVPNFILEDFDPGPLQDLHAVLDTLYLQRAVQYNLSTTPTISDGRPIMFYYHGSEHGEVGWTNMPLWEFDRTEVRQFADVLVRRWGLPPRVPNTGVGDGHAAAKAGWVTEEDILLP